MVQIRLNKPGLADSGNTGGEGAINLPGGDVTMTCPPHPVLADLPVARSIGKVVKAPERIGRVFFHVARDSPISVYGGLPHRVKTPARRPRNTNTTELLIKKQKRPREMPVSRQKVLKDNTHPEFNFRLDKVVKVCPEFGEWLRLSGFSKVLEFDDDHIENPSYNEKLWISFCKYKENPKDKPLVCEVRALRQHMDTGFDALTSKLQHLMIHSCKESGGGLGPPLGHEEIGSSSRVPEEMKMQTVLP